MPTAHDTEIAPESVWHKRFYADWWNSRVLRFTPGSIYHKTL